MIDTFKKTLLAGLGAAVVTSEKVQAGLEDFVKQGKISAADARAMAEKIAGEGKKEFEEVSAKLGDKVRELLAHVDGKHLPRIEALEARVAALEGKHEKTPKHKAKP
jgi:polyhydroxyalkanoate synthesis regulator phasin